VAALKNHVVIVQLLLQKHADVSICDKVICIPTLSMTLYSLRIYVTSTILCNWNWGRGGVEGGITQSKIAVCSNVPPGATNLHLPRQWGNAHANNGSVHWCLAMLHHTQLL